VTEAAAAAMLAVALAVTTSAGSRPPEQPAARCGSPVAGSAVHAATFTFQTSDKVDLDGAIVGAGNRGVVLVPEAGARGLCGWWPYATRIAKHKFRALLFDFRCSGLSSCPPRQPHAVAIDVRAAVAELRRRGCTRIDILGASLGGSAAIVAAAREKGIDAIVDLSGDENSVYLADTKPKTAFAAAAAIREPALLAVARGDPFVSIAETRRLFTELPSRTKRLDVLPANAGHGWDMLLDPGSASGWAPFACVVTRFLAEHTPSR
jgi:pimeloyl-ACP methyl ester carboxylesterase